jgi:hypothetical protein
LADNYSPGFRITLHDGAGQADVSAALLRDYSIHKTS